MSGVVLRRDPVLQVSWFAHCMGGPPASFTGGLLTRAHTIQLTELFGNRPLVEACFYSWGQMKWITIVGTQGTGSFSYLASSEEGLVSTAATSPCPIMPPPSIPSMLWTTPSGRILRPTKSQLQLTVHQGAQLDAQPSPQFLTNEDLTGTMSQFYPSSSAPGPSKSFLLPDKKELFLKATVTSQVFVVMTEATHIILVTKVYRF